MIIARPKCSRPAINASQDAAHPFPYHTSATQDLLATGLPSMIPRSPLAVAVSQSYLG
jgi:hypothetical protein